MKKILSTIIATFVALSMASIAKAEEVHFLTDMPAQHPPFLLSSWDAPIQWANDLGDPPMSCTSGASEQRSQCLFTADVPATVPIGAIRVLIRIKAVAQLISTNNPPDGQEEDALVLAHAYNPDTGENGNHIIHCEVWGDGSNGQQIRRRVCYTEAWLKIHDGKIYLRAGKRILVGGYTSITVTLEGYTN